MTDDLLTPFTPDNDTLDRYLAGHLDPETATRVAHWLDAVPARRAVLTHARELTSGIATMPSVATDDAMRALFQQIGITRVEDSVHRPVRPRGPWARRIGLWSAAIAMALIGVAMLNSSRSPNPVHRYHTAAGQRSTVRLADGSIVMLAPASTIMMTDREIEVSGEAYFTVATRAERPFVVRTSSVAVQVLGTRFSVRHYPSDTKSRVVVEDGRVAVQTLHHGVRDNARAVVSAGMSAFATDSGITVSADQDPQRLLGWTRGFLIFNSIALGDVVTDLMRAYDVDIRITDTTLAKEKMRMDVSVMDDSITQVLDRICNVSDAHYTRENRTYVLSPGRAISPTPRAVPQRHQFPQPEHQYGK